MSSTTAPGAPLDRLYRDLGFKPLSRAWGRVEMFLGLAGMAAGTFGMIVVSNEVVQQTVPTTRPQAFDFPFLTVIGAFLLFVFGGYLTLVGHRQHLYESNDRLTAYLADLIRSQAGPSGNALTSHPVPVESARDLEAAGR